MLFDIHSHILPNVDDGAQDLIESLRLLEIMQYQGITDCIATPHFYPHEDNLEDFLQTTDKAFEHLRRIANERKLPNIYLGCEMLYYEGIGNSESLAELCLNGSEFLLLELTDFCITNSFFEDIKALKEKLLITPIIAHAERYFKAKNYRKFLKFAEQEQLILQVNTASLFFPFYNRVIKKIFKLNTPCILATDAHSVDARPPKMAEALREVNKRFGRECRTRLINTSEWLFEKIVMEKDANA